MKDGFPVSVAELIAAGAWPFPGEAVAILLDVCEQVVRRPLAGAVPPAITPSALFLDGSGAVAVAGGVPVEDDQTVQLLGRLLLQMLPAPGTTAGARVPSRLRDLASRAAAGELDRISVRRLAASLRRFAPAQPKAALRVLFERWRQRDEAAGLPVGGGDTLVGDYDLSAALTQAELTSPGRARGHRRIVGALVGALLILASVSAAYWLNADTRLPPVPLSPSLLSEPAPPPARGWELLDPAGLATESRAPAPATEPASGDKTASAPQARDGSAQRPVQ